MALLALLWGLQHNDPRLDVDPDLDLRAHRVGEQEVELVGAKAALDVAAPRSVRDGAIELQRYLASLDKQLYEARRDKNGPKLPKGNVYREAFQPLQEAFARIVQKNLGTED